MDATHTIYVMLSNETWSVGISPTGLGTHYPDRATAIAAARRACRHKWELEGEPCHVRVRNENGLWEDAELYGTAWG
jgi:hypothetical protein